MDELLGTLVKQTGVTAHQIDDWIEELRARISNLDKLKLTLQDGCLHQWGQRQHCPATSHEDPPEGDWFRSCTLCKKVQLENV